jgi:hypothetical protein
MSSGSAVRDIWWQRGRGRTVFDADYCDGICDHGEHAVVIRVDLVRDVAVDEDVAWPRSSHDAFWDARVRASEPEDLPVCTRNEHIVPTQKGRTVFPPRRCRHHRGSTRWGEKKPSGPVIVIEIAPWETGPWRTARRNQIPWCSLP